MNFICITHKKVGYGLLIEAEITQIELFHQIPLKHGKQFTDSKNLEHTTCLADRSTVWRVSFPDISVGLNHYSICLRRSLRDWKYLYLHVEQNSNDSVKFQELSEDNLCCLLADIYNIFCRIEYFTSTSDFLQFHLPVNTLTLTSFPSRSKLLSWKKLLNIKACFFSLCLSTNRK